jgi:hypothetical protein
MPRERRISTLRQSSGDSQTGRARIEPAAARADAARRVYSWPKQKGPASQASSKVELAGLEPATSWVRSGAGRS